MPASPENADLLRALERSAAQVAQAHEDLGDRKARERKTAAAMAVYQNAGLLFALAAVFARAAKDLEGTGNAEA